MMRRVVFDTSILVAALRSTTGASNELLRLVARQRLVPLLTPALFLEYEDLLKRDEHRQVHGLDLGQIDRLLAAFAAASEPVRVTFQWRPQLLDPADEMVLETAVNGRADALVTHNLRDFRAATRFGLRVLRPFELLAEISR